MPNTLAHLGINGLITRKLIKQSDLLLIYLGALIPDIPWIFQRAALAFIPNINPYDLRLYCVIQASLFLSVVLSAAIAFLFIDTNRTFIIFAVGSLIHLLLDSIEIKWANGVHLFAPFNWELFNAGYFWPENVFIYVLTVFGIIYLLFHWKEALSSSFNLSVKNITKLVLSFSCLIIYFSLPLIFLTNAEEANNHFVQTLRGYEHRPGKYFEVDRGNYINDPGGDKYITPFNEELKISNLNLSTTGSMSIKAKFLSQDKIQILDYHIHSNRDIYSYIALLLLLALLIISFVKKTKFNLRSW